MPSRVWSRVNNRPDPPGQNGSLIPAGQTGIDEGLSMRKTPFWVVWAENGGVPTHMHDSLHSATQEAERLARMHKGQAFHVLQSYGACIVDDMHKIDLRPDSDPYDQIPF